MPTLSREQAVEKLAMGVEQAKPSELPEIYSEIFPTRALNTAPVACDIATHIRGGLEAEEIVDLWNVVFPEDRHVWYDEEAQAICYNEEMVGYFD